MILLSKNEIEVNMDEVRKTMLNEITIFDKFHANSLALKTHSLTPLQKWCRLIFDIRSRLF